MATFEPDYSVYQLARMERPHYTDHDALAGFKVLNIPVWIFDVDRHALWWANPQALAFWKADTISDLAARDFSSDSDVVRTRLRQIVDGGGGNGRVQDSWTLYPADEPHTVLLSFTPVKISTGRNAVLVEVTGSVEQVQDAEALRVLEAARSTTLMVSTFTFDGTLLAQNPSALASMATKAPNMIGNDLGQRIQDRDLVDVMLKAAVDGRSFEAELEVNTANGPRTHRIQVKKGRDPISGDFVAVVTEEDVSDRVKVRQQLKMLNEVLEAQVKDSTKALTKSEERYALAVKSASIWDWDLVSDELFVSPRFGELLGYEAIEFQEILAARDFERLVYEPFQEKFYTELIAHLRNAPEPVEHEVQFVSKAGIPRWYRAQGMSFSQSGQIVTRTVGLLSDITEQKAMEASLFESQRMEAIGQLTGGIAHDFNNLLTTIMGNAELLQFGEQPTQEFIAEIMDAGKKGAELTQQLLSYALRQRLSPKALDLGNLIAGMGEMLSRLLGDAIQVETSVPDDLWPVMADIAQVETAVVKLAINARDAMPQGGTLMIHCENETVLPNELGANQDPKPGDYVALSILDTGSGMPSETLARAFDPFFTTKDVGQGSGLGLSMVYGFAKQSGGSVRLSSTPTVGTEVILCLPRWRERKSNDESSAPSNEG